MSGWRTLLSLVLALPLAGCAGDYVSRTANVRRAYEAGRTDDALKGLDDVEKDDKSKDELLFLLDRGMVLHAAGRWQESISVVAKADQLSQQLDVVSVSEEAGALVTNEREKAYRGEDFEKLMITVLQALNYAALGKDEDALVEVRRCNERLQKMIVDEKKPYEQLAVARYLSGVFWEDAGHWDDAYIDYAKAAEFQPELGALAEPLLRLSKKTGRDTYDEWVKRYPGMEHGPLKPEEGQLLVVVEAGKSPEKSSGTRPGQFSADNQLIQVPVFRNRWNAPPVRVSVDGGPPQQTVVVTDLAKVAKVHLDDRMGRMIAKQLAGTAVKAGLATGVGVLTKSKEAGVLAFLALSMFNAPDLRSWLSLPAEFQLTRLRLPAGQHTVRVAGVDRTVEVKPGRIALVVVRQY